MATSNVRSNSATIEQIISRMDYIRNFFDDLKFSLSIGSGLEICERTLLCVLQRYFHDIKRYKDFHETEYIDGVKRAAFTAKWILKLRPVYITHKPQTLIEHFGNELLALKLGFVFAKIPPQKLNDDLALLVFYTFKYRRLDEDSLILWFKTLSIT